MNVKTIKNSDNFYEQIWESGELKKAAKRCSTAAQLAKYFGKTGDGLVRGLYRLRQKGHKVPSIRELLDEAAGNIADEIVDEAKKIWPDVRHGNEGVATGARNDWSEGWEEPTRERKVPKEELNLVEEHRLKRKVRDLEERNKELLDQIASVEDRLEIVKEAMEHRVDPITPRERWSGLREGTPVFLLSDLHLEEEVKPESVGYVNQFNLAIARSRMTRLFEGIRWFTETQRQTFAIKDVCVWLGGDMFTNYLHDDNIESNQLAPPAAFAFAKQLITDGLRYILEDKSIERLVVPCNDGNHGRMTKELRSASRTDMSLETLMYGMMASEFADDPRVQFEIAQGDHLYTTIHNKIIRWTHGAEVRGGMGIGGITVPLYRAMSRWETVRHADLTVGGHFHTRLSFRDIEMNGSLIGYNAYAQRIGARFEEPAQSAFMIDSKRGKALCTPLWVSDPDEEANE